MSTIGFLHTSYVHEPVFRSLVDEVGRALADPVGVVTAVDADLLDAARSLGPSHPDVVTGVSTRLTELVAAGADVVVCTCSTIGGVAESIGADLGLRTVRVDRAMAERAVAIGGRIVVLAALESTLAPTSDLLVSVAGAAGWPSEPTIELRLVVGAWERFEADDLDGYIGLVADEITRAATDADVIVLAQASMAAAAGRVDSSVPVLSSPRPAIDAVLGLT